MMCPKYIGYKKTGHIKNQNKKKFYELSFDDTSPLFIYPFYLLPYLFILCLSFPSCPLGLIPRVLVDLYTLTFSQSRKQASNIKVGKRKHDNWRRKREAMDGEKGKKVERKMLTTCVHV